MAIGGYHGRARKVDLSTGTVTDLPLDDDVLRRFVGGVGLGTWLLARESPAGVDPLDPDAAIVVALSPLVGTPLTTSAKFAVVAKSPLTDRIGDALSSDRFAIDLKRTGIDALVVVGRAPRLSVLALDGDEVAIEDAVGLAGRSSREVEEVVRARSGGTASALSIGPAGEALVRFATVSTGSRHAGRGGLGAVFGSKNLKAVVARGRRPTPLADAEAVLATSKDLSRRSMGPATAKYRELGTIANVLALNRLGAMPTRNFSAGSFDGAESVAGEAFHRDAPSVRRHCAACTIGCEHAFAAEGGAPVRLEYEGLFALGPLCGIDDRDAILAAARACDDLGIDVISAGATVAFAMEAAERGLLEGHLTAGDVVPGFADAASLAATLRAIGARSPGLGDLLAEGSRRAAARLGRGAERLAVHVKGMELPG
jgi:aldehyde:ferredoxin oxidoreductase